MRVGDDQKEYHFKKDDICWRDIEFESSKKFIYNALIRYTDGDERTDTGVGTIDYKKDEIHTTVNGTNNSELRYKRVEDK